MASTTAHTYDFKPVLAGTTPWFEGMARMRAIAAINQQPSGY